MGKFDITAMIDKVLEVSGEEKIFYIGHSMGTTGTKRNEDKFEITHNLIPLFLNIKVLWFLQILGLNIKIKSI